MWSCDRRTFLKRAAALSVAAPLLSACGFEPLYGESAPARALQGQVDVPVLPGLFGFAMRERLVTRLGPASAPAYELAIESDVEEVERAIRRDRSITRFNLNARADYRLESLTTGTTLTSGSVRETTAYSAVASPFATRAAEEDARRRLAVALADRIILRLAASAAEFAP
ncbi:LPS assembly lipoprotein LptE [Oceanibium sediminis]|uniref:LPS assembly lipoprotein LptE n=1 Tax=Oceanibium sediminis TaxID=2026339 RepID=UPI000DD47CCD|nr:LPS assembly lipoprotein LptE [Oceanibium sediminis]